MAGTCGGGRLRAGTSARGTALSHLARAGVRDLASLGAFAFPCCSRRSPCLGAASGPSHSAAADGGLWFAPRGFGVKARRKREGPEDSVAECFGGGPLGARGARRARGAVRLVGNGAGGYPRFSSNLWVNSAGEVAGTVPCLFANRLAFFKATVVGSRVPLGLPQARVLPDAEARVLPDAAASGAATVSSVSAVSTATLSQSGGVLVVDERASSSGAGINHALLPCRETNPADFRPIFCFHV